MENKMIQWFSVRCIFHHPNLAKEKGKFLYEERILLWETENIDKAIELAESEAKKYADKSDCIYMGLAQAFSIYITKPESGSEVFSLMRDNNSTPDDYLDSYFDTGNKRQKK